VKAPSLQSPGEPEHPSCWFTRQQTWVCYKTRVCAWEGIKLGQENLPEFFNQLSPGVSSMQIQLAQPHGEELNPSDPPEGICQLSTTPPRSAKGTQKDEFVTNSAWHLGRSQATLWSRGNLQNKKYEQMRDGQRFYHFTMMIYLFCIWLQMLIKQNFQEHFSFSYFFSRQKKKNCDNNSPPLERFPYPCHCKKPRMRPFC